MGVVNEEIFIHFEIFSLNEKKKKEANVKTLSVLCTELATQTVCGDAERGLVVNYFLLVKVHNRPLGIDPTTSFSLSNPLLWENEVPIVLELISCNLSMLNCVLPNWRALL